MRGSSRILWPPILIILSCHGSEHVEHHSIDGAEHAGGELIGLRGHHPRCRQVECDDLDLAGVEFASQPLPVGVRQAAQPIDLLDEQDIARPGVGEQPEELWPGQRGARDVFDVEAGDA